MDYFKAFQDFVEGERIGKKQALFFQGKATTYGELIEEASRVSDALSKHEIRKGDAVGIYMGNCREFLSIFLGLARCGAIAQPISILLTEYEIHPQLENTGCKLIFVAPEYLPVMEKIRPRLPQLKTAVVMAAEAGGKGISYSEFLNGSEGSYSSVALGGDDTVLILFTGGTTGTPKAVMLTHKNLLSVTQGLSNRISPCGEMPVLCASPLSHIFGLNTITFAALFRKSPGRPRTVVPGRGSGPAH